MARQYSDGSTYFQFFAKIALTYVASSPAVKKEDVETIVDNVDEPELKYPFMSALEQYRQDAIQAAKIATKKTEEKKSREFVINLLEEVSDFSEKKIAKIAGVTISFVRKIKKELREKK